MIGRRASDGEAPGTRPDVLGLLPVRRGHFRLESGHHGDLWLDLELLCLHPEPIRRLAAQLAQRIAPHDVEAVCGPLIEGAFVALTVAADLGVPFGYSERSADGRSEGLFPKEYRVPRALRGELRGKRVALVNDVINAGSAVRGTFADLERCGATPIAIGALAVLGSSAARFAADKGVALESLESLPNSIWTPTECPLCARGVPLSADGGSAGA
jgi:orotate phosphoribosyltransferase